MFREALKTVSSSSPGDDSGRGAFEAYQEGRSPEDEGQLGNRPCPRHLITDCLRATRHQPASRGAAFRARRDSLDRLLHVKRTVHGNMMQGEFYAMKQAISRTCSSCRGITRAPAEGRVVRISTSIPLVCVS